MITKTITSIREIKEHLPTIQKGCYIAGPVTGVTGYKSAFMRAEAFLKELGVPALNPAYHPKGLPYESYFPICYAMIDASAALLFLPGWKNSKGAVREKEYAERSEREYLFIDYEAVIETTHIRGNACAPEIGNLLFGNYRGGIPVSRAETEEIFGELLEALQFDSYAGNFSNEVFSITPYYWGDDEALQAVPNFIYHPAKFHMRWYKYALRDAYANQDMTVEAFRKMIAHCIESLKSKKAR